MLIHFIKLKDLLVLEEHFAVLTEEGWVIPQWLVLLHETRIGD